MILFMTLLQHTVLETKGASEEEKKFIAVDLRKQLGRTHRKV